MERTVSRSMRSSGESTSRSRVGVSASIACSSRLPGEVVQLVCGCEEVAVGETGRRQRRQRDAAEQRPEQDQLQPHGVHRVGACEQHADHRARKEDHAGCLGRVDQRDHPRAQAAAQRRQHRLRARWRREPASPRCAPAPERTSSPSRLSDTAAAVIALPDDHAADRHQEARLGLEDAERPRPARASSTAATDSAISSGTNEPGTERARPRAVRAPKTTITAISANTKTRLSWSKIALIT